MENVVKLNHVSIYFITLIRSDELLTVNVNLVKYLKTENVRTFKYELKINVNSKRTKLKKINLTRIEKFQVEI